MIDEKETKPDSVPLSPQLEKDLKLFVKSSCCNGSFTDSVAGFAYNIIVGDGLTFVRPSEELLKLNSLQATHQQTEDFGEGVNVCIVDTGLQLNPPISMVLM